MKLVTLVPVLDRPENVRPLVLSFLTSGQPGILVFICEIGDEAERLMIERARTARVEVVEVVDAHTWPEKINAGYDAYKGADWYLCAADDVSFMDGWWDATRELREQKWVGVIGTNDSPDGTGNPAVANGQHTCHPLVRGSYIEQRGIWGEKDKIVSEDYHHWYVDNELVVTAKLREAWAFCREAVLHHHHPYWEGGELDDTYRLGESNSDKDYQTWIRRSEQFGPLIAGNPH